MCRGRDTRQLRRASAGQREHEQVILVVTDRAGLADTGKSGPRGLIDRVAYLSAATQVARAAAVALRGVPCVTLARSEVPREELESEDRACLPDISHHARTGLACKNRQEPLGASCYAGRRLVGRRTIIDHGHLLGGGVAGIHCGKSMHAFFYCADQHNTCKIRNSLSEACLLGL